jgi:hypothetical protein
MRTKSRAQHRAAAWRSPLCCALAPGSSSGLDPPAAVSVVRSPILSRASSSSCQVAPAGPALSVTVRRSLALGASTPQ